MTARTPVEFVDENGHRVGNKVELAANIGGDEQALLTDELTGALSTIDVIHHEVHIGEMFMGEHSASVLNGANLDIRLLTGANGCHATFEINVGGQATLYIYEAANISVGTVVNVWNMKRTATGIAPFQMWHTPTVTGTGTVALVNGRLLAGGTNPTSRVGTGSRQNLEWILKPATEYLIRVTNSSGGAIIENVVVNGYEG